MNDWCDETLTDEKSLKAFNKPAKEMYDKFFKILTDLGMTKEGAKVVCDTDHAYFDFFDYENHTGELTEKGKRTLDNWKEHFGTSSESEFKIWYIDREFSW